MHHWLQKGLKMDWDIWDCIGATERLEMVFHAESGDVSTTSTWILKEMLGENTRKCECCMEETPSILTYEGSEYNPNAYVKTDCNVESLTLESLQAQWYVCADCIETQKTKASLGNDWVLFRIEILINEYERFTGMPTIMYDDILDSLESGIQKLAKGIKQSHVDSMPNSVNWIRKMIKC